MKLIIWPSASAVAYNWVYTYSPDDERLEPGEVSERVISENRYLVVAQVSARSSKKNQQKKQKRGIKRC
jgi:hypothetical protein